MSWYAIAWAEKAPVATVYERAILTYLAHRANKDGTDCYPSTGTLAKFALCDKRTVQRHLDTMIERGLIAEGDQRAAYKIQPRYRPTVYDLLIPHVWYSEDQLAEVNEERAERGMEPLRAEDRPQIAPPPAKKDRADKGKANPKRSRKKATTDESATSENDEGCLSDTPHDESADDGRGDSETPLRGDSETRLRGVSVPPKTVPGDETDRGETVLGVSEGETSVRPSGTGRAHDADGRTEEVLSNEEQATALMYEDQAARQARRLGPWQHQTDQIHAALVTLLGDTNDDVPQVRGFFLSKLAEAQTVSYVIDGLTTYASEVGNAEPEQSPEERRSAMWEHNAQLIERDRYNGTDAQEPSRAPKPPAKPMTLEEIDALNVTERVKQRMRQQHLGHDLHEDSGAA